MNGLTRSSTRRLRNWTSVAVLCLSGLISAGCRPLPQNSVAHQDSSKWEREIAAFEASDRTNLPPQGCILFVGSSSIRLWDSLKTDFPGLPVVNRGFGGSEIADSVKLAERIIVRYRPREVVIYAGGNDIAAGKLPEVVYGDFVALVTRIQRRLPHTKIAFISSAPNPKRWSMVDNVKRLNSLVQAYCAEHGLTFIDVFPRMLGRDGLPKPDIFRDDRLHMNAKGYAIWTEAVGPVLK